MTKKVLIIESGMAGGVLACELTAGKFDVTVIDMDNLKGPYNNDLMLPLDVKNTYYSDENHSVMVLGHFKFMAWCN